MRRIAFFVYGLICYGLTLAAIGVGVLFFGNFIGQSVDSVPRVAWPLALAINVGLVEYFRESCFRCDKGRGHVGFQCALE